MIKDNTGNYIGIRAQRRLDFIKELSSVINRYSMENEWDMPDFLMAELIADFIYSSGKTMKQNLHWHGTDSTCHPKDSNRND